jgi:hypothetical protein
VQNILSSRLLSEDIKFKIYRTIILPVFFHGYETWLLILREKHRLRVLENRVLRRIFGLKRDEVTGEWRRVGNEKRNDLYSTKYYSSDEIEKHEKGGHVAGVEERRGGVQDFGGETSVKEATWKT